MAENERLRVGFVGCGGIASLYIDIYAALVDVAQVVAVADLQPERAEKRRADMTAAYESEIHRARLAAYEARDAAERERHLRRAEAAQSAASAPIRTYRSHEELLRDDEVQVMVLLTTPPVRVEPTVAAAEAGRHIFTQGPLATSVQEADAMVAAAKKAGVRLQSQCGARYPRGMALAKRAIAGGHLGGIGSARVELNWYRNQSYYRGWHGTWAGEGGGAAFHHGRYIIDPFLWVVGSPVVELFAYAGPVLRQVEHESLSQAVLRFANGAQGMIHASLLSHRQKLTPEGRIEVLGNDASLLIGNEYYPNGPSLTRRSYYQADVTFGSSDNPAAIERLEALRGQVTDVPEQADEIYQARLFLESILHNREPVVPIEVPRHHVEVVRAIYKSAEERRPVTLPLAKDDPFYGKEGRLTHGVKRPV